MITSTTSDVRSRIADFLKRSDELKVPWRSAAIVAVVSVNESASTFNMPRSASLPYDVKCYPARQVLIAELGNPRLGTRLPVSWTQDEELMRYLAQNSLLSGFAADSLSESLAETDSLQKPNNGLAGLFEFLLDKRKLKALEVFSIGPTQMFLKQAPLTGGSLSMFPQDLNAIWAFYTMTDVKTAWDAGWWSYLKTNVFNYPTPNSTVCGHAESGACVESYLEMFQAGKRNWGTEAHWQKYAADFLRNVKMVWDIGRSNGYDTDPKADINKRRTI